MFMSFFIKSLMMLKKYGKMFSIYSFFIIGVMNFGFLIRAIIYNTSLSRYSSTPFEEIKHNSKITKDFKTFLGFQQEMMVASIIDWILNMAYDIIVLKMYSVYQTFHA